jgi:hypothetical protein
MVVVQTMEKKIMNSVIAIIVAMLQLIPALITALKAIEEAIPGEGKGEAKLTAVRGIIEASHEKALTYWPAIEKVIGVLVATFNKTGIFQKA